MTKSPGFLVVVAVLPQDGELSNQYVGVDRVPAFPAQHEEETYALQEYVLGDYKDQETNLIPTREQAVQLLEMLSASPRRFEIVLCCADPASVRQILSDADRATELGYDVAAIRADYWSIVNDMPGSEWVSRFRTALNEFGLFSRRADAARYLDEYRFHKEADGDSPFEVIYVVRCSPPSG